MLEIKAPGSRNLQKHGRFHIFEGIRLSLPFILADILCTVLTGEGTLQFLAPIEHQDFLLVHGVVRSSIGQPGHLNC